MNILTVNLVFSTLVFGVAAKLYVLPRLPELRPQTVLLPILFLRSLRHLGLMFLAPGATYAGLPMPFAYPGKPIPLASRRSTREVKARRGRQWARAG